MQTIEVKIKFTEEDLQEFIYKIANQHGRSLNDLENLTNAQKAYIKLTGNAYKPIVYTPKPIKYTNNGK
jgi:hypothetical protein